MQINYKIAFPELYFSGFSKIWYQILITGPLFFFLVITAGCDSDNTGKENTEGQTPDVDVAVNIKQLTEETAIGKVKFELQQTNKTITVPVHYWEFETKRVPCDQYDVAYGRGCSEPGIGAPHGYKRKSESVRKCCRDKKISVSGAGGQWKAVYAEAEDSWVVECELGIEDIKKILAWRVGDKDGMVSETGQ